MSGFWYAVSRRGMAVLCVDEADAKAVAKQESRNWPQHAPYTAMQLVELTPVRAAAADLYEASLALLVQLDRIGMTREEEPLMDALRAALAKAEGKA